MVLFQIYRIRFSHCARVPSHAYEYHGDAVLGRDLKELQLGMDVRRRIDAISQNFYIQGNYTYLFVERVLDIPNNRSNAKVEGIFLLTERLTLEGRLTWQHAHGGLRFGAPPGTPVNVITPEAFDQHDRLQVKMHANFVDMSCGPPLRLTTLQTAADHFRISPHAASAVQISGQNCLRRR